MVFLSLKDKHKLQSMGLMSKDKPRQLTPSLQQKHKRHMEVYKASLIKNPPKDNRSWLERHGFTSSRFHHFFG